MNPLFILWEKLVWQPQINLLYLFYKQFNDIGWSLVLLAVVANIPLLWLYSKSYINIQKSRMLQPQLQSIQKKYKDDALEMRKQTVEFYKKHNVNNSYMMYMLVFQLFFITGLFTIVSELQKNAPVGALYSFLVPSSQFQFPIIAFGFLDITAQITTHIWILVLNAILSLFYGLYTFKWAPQIKLPENPDRTAEEIEQAKAMEKSQMFIGVYFSPILLTAINFTLPIGVNLYGVVASIMSITRQVLITNFYAKETETLYRQIIESDQSLSDMPLNSVEISSLSDTANVVEINSKPVQVKIKPTQGANDVKDISSKPKNSQKYLQHKNFSKSNKQKNKGNN